MKDWKDNFCVFTGREHARFKNLCEEYDIQYCIDCSGIYNYYGYRNRSNSLSDYPWGKVFASVDDFEMGLQFFNVTKSIDKYSII